ncbi:hypothetical protein [Sporosarcina gallistercoris]|uniref:DUF8042 domain-containing protein n=1 Tax=Sporosarcina gallistercoris TaxID=2762245 RepID=A0ABR8PNF8_9BACL|nr:hypothetical protein [Sporosarcina gallistercoris]MBD7909609.1 hypothetical protein [Sporosarcina gallistercoris]
MELIFPQKIVMLDNPTIELIFEKVNECILKGYYFSHFIADGIELENYEDYLNHHIGHISQLVVVAKTVQDHVNDLLLSTGEYIKRAIPEMLSLSDEFYNNPKSVTWVTLEELLEGLQWINEMLVHVGQSETVPSNWENYLEVAGNMQEHIRNLAEAVENEDSILIGDIIQYELLMVFEELQKEILGTIDNEGMRHDLN